MKTVFVSYRRYDSSDVTGRIFEHLKKQFDNKSLFKDVDGIDYGDDYRGPIIEALAQCKVLLAVIGDDWLTVTDEQGNRRIESTDDPVHFELATALRRRIPIIPVLVEQATVPKEKDLPAQLSQIAYCNGIQVRPDPDFGSDMERLCKALRKRGVGHRFPAWSVYAALGLAVTVVALLSGPFASLLGDKPVPIPKSAIEPSPTDHLVDYRITVYTKNVPDSKDDPSSMDEGTNAYLAMTVIGKRDQAEFDAKKFNPDTGKDNFEPTTSPDVFSVTSVDVGEIQKLELHVNHSFRTPWKEPNWLLDRVEIENMETNRKWTFSYGKWIDFKNGLNPQEDISLVPDGA